MMKRASITFTSAALVLVLAPLDACAKAGEQAATATGAKGTTGRANTASTGVTLQRFLKRHEQKLLAKDTDGDGKVSRAEFIAGATSGKGDPAKRFGRIDRNGDGVIDKSEIDAMLTRRFKRLDANGDGVASVDERGAAHSKKSKAAPQESDS